MSLAVLPNDHAKVVRLLVAQLKKKRNKRHSTAAKKMHFSLCVAKTLQEANTSEISRVGGRRGQGAERKAEKEEEIHSKRE